MLSTVSLEVLCYPRNVRKEDLIAFARRDWDAIAALKRRRWTEQKSRMTAAEALSVGDELRHHVSTLREWPTDEERQEDLALAHSSFGDAPSCQVNARSLSSFAPSRL